MAKKEENPVLQEVVLPKSVKAECVNVNGDAYTAKLVAGAKYRILEKAERGLPIDALRNSMARAEYEKYFGSLQAKQAKPAAKPEPKPAAKPAGAEG